MNSKSKLSLTDQVFTEDEAGFIVVVGSSAGGIDALREFLSVRPLKQNSYVFIQHMSPNFNTLLPDIIKESTGLELKLAEDGQRLKPGQMILLPPNKLMTIEDGLIKLESRSEKHEYNYYPIDYFFESVAQGLSSRVIGVILSGTGRDGSKGIEAIQENAGYVMVQSPQSAKFDGMPISALATKKVNISMNAKDMHSHLNHYTSGTVDSLLRDFVGVGASMGGLNAPPYLEEVYSILKKAKGIDFSFYNQSVLTQRINTRLKITNSTDLKNYAEVILDNKEELENLYLDLLSSSSTFFEFPECLEAFQKVILPEIIHNVGSKKALRFWVVGCGTGEEAYTYAMLIDEYLTNNRLDIAYKVFATDVNYEALRYAGKASYPEEALSFVPQRLHEVYCTNKNGMITFKDKTRKNIIFAGHDIIQSTSFASIDFISCRGVLGLFREEFLPKLLKGFVFSLTGNREKGGFLLLDQDQELEAAKPYFQTFPRAKQFFQAVPLDKAKADRSKVKDKRQTPIGRESVVLKLYENLPLGQVPPTILFNEDFSVDSLFGDLNGIVKVPSGKASNNLTALVTRKLFDKISSLKQDLGDNKTSASDFIRFVTPEKVTQLLNVTVSVADAETDLFSAEIEKVGKGLSNSGVLSEMNKTEQTVYFLDLEVEKLNRLLTEKDNEMSLLVNQLQVYNEELRSINEELQTGGEELQSSNEELEAVNEELKALNLEYQFRISEASKLELEVQHIYDASRIGVLFISPELEIQKFNAYAQKILRLISDDTGRPLKHFTYDMSVDFPEKILSVIKTLNPYEEEIVVRGSQHFSMRIFPCQNDDFVFTGVVVTFLESRAQVASATKKKPKKQSLSEEANSIYVLMDNTHRILKGSDKFFKFFGISKNDEPLESDPFIKFINHNDQNRFKRLLGDCELGKIINFDFESKINNEQGETSFLWHVKSELDRKNQSFQYRCVGTVL